MMGGRGGLARFSSVIARERSDRSNLWTWLGFAVVGWLFLARPAQAQTITGVVLATDGSPISSALVILWDHAGERGRTATSPSGKFTLTIAPGVTPTSINVRALGYQPDGFPLRGLATTDLVLHLAPYASPLPDLLTRAVPICPNQETAGARALWQSMRQRYDVVPLDRGVAELSRWRRSQVTADRVGVLDEAALTPEIAGVSGEIRSSADGMIAASGYAVSMSKGKGIVIEMARNDERFLHWWYPSLERWNADHWLGDLFGARHTVSLRQAEGGPKELVFCGTGKGPNVEAVLTLSADTTLTRASWRFRTPAPDENAGGLVTFLPLSATDSRQLIPMTSVVWRNAPEWRGRFFQEAAAYEAFRYGESTKDPGMRWSDSTKGLR